VSKGWVAKRMGEIEAKEGILLKYRSILSLHLTSLQVRILEAITPEKIENASLVELARAFKILKDIELKIRPEAFKIKGFVGYLLEIEKEEKYLQMINNDAQNIS